MFKHLLQVHYFAWDDVGTFDTDASWLSAFKSKLAPTGICGNTEAVNTQYTMGSGLACEGVGTRNMYAGIQRL